MLLCVPRVPVVPVVVDSLTRPSRAGFFCLGLLGGLGLAATLGLLTLGIATDIKLLPNPRRKSKLIGYDGRAARLLTTYGGHGSFYGLLAIADESHAISVARSTTRQAMDRANKYMTRRGLPTCSALAPSRAAETLAQNVSSAVSQARRLQSGMRQMPRAAFASLAARRGGVAGAAAMAAGVASGAFGSDTFSTVASSAGSLAATCCSAATCAINATGAAANVAAIGKLVHFYHTRDCIARTDLHFPIRRATYVNADGDWRSWKTLLAKWCVGIDVSADDATFMGQVESYLGRCFYHPEDVVSYDAGERIISAYESVRDGLISAAFAALAHAQFRAHERNELFELLEASDFACGTNSGLKVWLNELLVELAVKKELASRLEAA